MATQNQLRAAIQAARERGWEPVNGNTLAAPSCGAEIPTPGHIPEQLWSGETYTRRTSVSFVVIESAKGEPRISAAFLREHPAPWVDARESKVSFKRAIEILESE